MLPLNMMTSKALVIYRNIERRWKQIDTLIKRMQRRNHWKDIIKRLSLYTRMMRMNKSKHRRNRRSKSRRRQSKSLPLKTMNWTRQASIGIVGEMRDKTRSPARQIFRGQRHPWKRKARRIKRHMFNMMKNMTKKLLMMKMI